MVRRRSLLRVLGASVAVGLAGCNALTEGERDDSPDSDARSTTPPTTPSTTAPVITPTATLAPDDVTQHPSTAGGGTPNTPPAQTTTTTLPEEVGTQAITPGDGDSNASFGGAIELAADFAVITSDDTALTFEPLDETWARTAQLTPADREDFGFGASVDVVGDTAFVGGPDAGDDAGGRGGRHGAISVFERSGDGWTRRARLTSPAAGGGNRDFGRSFAADGERIVASDVSNGGPDSPWAGSAFVFRRRGGDWTHEATLETGNENLFGFSIAVEGDRILASAPAARSDGGGTGAVYVFDREGDKWSERGVLTPPADAPHKRFGSTLALDGDTVVVGSPDVGRIYVFQRTDDALEPETTSESPRGTRSDLASGDWVLRTLLPAPGYNVNDVAEGDAFGSSITLGDEVAVVGAPNAGSRFDRRAGRAYVLRRDDWRVDRQLVPGTLTADARFGAAVSLRDGSALVGSPGFRDVGRAYRFDL